MRIIRSSEALKADVFQEVIVHKQMPERAVDDSDPYLTLSELSQESGYTAAQLRRFLEEGSVSGVKVGGVWLSSMSALSAFEGSMHAKVSGVRHNPKRIK